MKSVRVVPWVILMLVLGVGTYVCAAGADSINVTSQQLGDHIFLLSCTVDPFVIQQVASVGPDGILLVDAGLPREAPRLKEALQKLGNGRVRFLINTHSHDDHTGGNRAFRDETTIIAHRNARNHMVGAYYSLPPIQNPDAPSLVVDDTLSIWFNGEEVRLIHVPSAHTDGDLIVQFVGSKIVCVGDLVFPDVIPFADVATGGSGPGYVASVKHLAESFSEDTRFVATHGRIYSKQDMQAYYDMLQQTFDKVKQAMAQGQSPDSMVKGGVLSAWDSKTINYPTLTTGFWTATLYQGLIPQQTSSKPSICGPISETLIRNGVQAAISHYRELKAGHPDQYEFGENELNMLGYNLLMRQMMPEAVDIFKLNTEMFPESFNVYDSYGEVLLAKGDTAQSIINYKKSLKLNRNNTNAVGVLKQLGVK